MQRWCLSAIMVVFYCIAAHGGETIPPAEIQALDRAISRELNSGALGSQVLGDLTRLRNRLAYLNTTPSAASAAVAVGEAGDPQVSLLTSLEREAAGGGGRSARRALAFFYMYLNEPEKARDQWQLMGKGSEYDISYLLISAFLEIALGEHNIGRASVESALSMLQARSPLKVTNPIFCQNVAGFRVYEPVKANNFLPGDDILIYVEIEGAQFSDSREGCSECSLMFGLKLKDDNQGTVWAEPNFGEYMPLFNGPIRDLHAVLTWKVPNNLEPGRYHLTVEAVEDATRRRGEGVTGFEVGRRPTNPEKRPTGWLDPKTLEALPPNFTEMQSVFPGAPVLPGTNSSYQRGSTGINTGVDVDKDKYELLQRYMQNQRQ